MGDIVDELEIAAATWEDYTPKELLNEAADEIKRLRSLAYHQKPTTGGIAKALEIARNQGMSMSNGDPRHLTPATVYAMYRVMAESTVPLSDALEK